MHDFLTGLQFLTRIRIANQTEWSAESFGRSVRYFPLIGGIIGLLLVAVNVLLSPYLPAAVVAAIVITWEIILTGGLHGDGLMDTADGVFSGRNRDRMLEIMKDSRVGANGVMAFGILLLLKWTMLTELVTAERNIALFVMPIFSRFAMVIGITLFPYARPDGIGKAFAQYAGRTALIVAALFTIVVTAYMGISAFISLGAVLVFTMVFCRYITQLLGGLTGDIYGAITELSELVTLLVYLIVRL